LSWKTAWLAASINGWLRLTTPLKQINVP
jgi:hypothetical protein